MVDKRVIRIRDEIMEALLRKFSETPFIQNNMVLKGGSALHYFYGSPRYSADLDFAAFDFTGQHDQILAAVTQPVLLKNTWPLTVTPKKVNNDFIHTTYSLTGDIGEVAAHVDVGGATALRYHASEGKYSPLLVTDPSEIANDKVLASLERFSKWGLLKPTDLYDLEFLMHHLDARANLAGIMEKAESDGRTQLVNPELIGQVMAYIENTRNHPKFKDQIKKTMLPDAYATRTYDEKYFHHTTEHFQRIQDEISAEKPESAGAPVHLSLL